MNSDLEPRDSVLGILKAAIEIEKFGIRYYKALASAVDNEKGKALLNYLADAEEKHQIILEDEYNKQQEVGDEASKSLPFDNLDEDGKQSIFSEPLQDVDPTEISAIEAVKYGLHVEERTMRFYNDAAKVMTDVALQDILNSLLRFEQGHFELLKKNLDQLERDDTWFGHLPIVNESK